MLSNFELLVLIQKMTAKLVFQRYKNGSKYRPKIFRYKGVNGGQNRPQKPSLTVKIAALTAFKLKNSGVSGVEPEN